MYTHKDGCDKKTETSVGEEVEKLAPSYAAAGNVSGAAALENNSAVLQNLNIVTMRPRISTPRSVPKGTEHRKPCSL